MKHYEPSPTVMVSFKASQMRTAGIQVHNFSIGDLVLPNHPAILEAAAEALKEKSSPYPPIAGLPELRKEAAVWMNRRYLSTYTPSQTLVTCGGKFALFAALRILLDQGDEVLIAAPYWVSYPDMVKEMGGIPTIAMAKEEEGWKITPEILKTCLTQRTKALIFNNPCNPTGVVYSRDEVKAILQFAQSANLWVIADEVYSELVFDHLPFCSCASFPEHKNHVVIIESCSKNFAMGGWRVGFAFGPQDLIDEMIALQSQSTTGTSYLSQRAALGALRHSDEVARYVRNAVEARRNAFFAAWNTFSKTPALPVPSTMYFFVKIDQDASQILEHARVAVVPGSAFGIEGYVRFSFCDKEDAIYEGLRAFFIPPLPELIFPEQ